MLSASIGCQTTNYKAASLPPGMRVAPSAGVKRIHLPNLAAAGKRSTELRPGDLLDVSIVSGLEEEAPRPNVLQVSTRGDVDLPLIGPVQVAGLEPSDASRAIVDTAVERGVYRRPSVTLEVRERATHQVTVLGAVNEPGVHELPVGACDVLSAIAAAGGLTEDAGAEVEVMRQPTETRLAASSGVQTASYQPTTTPAAAPVLERIDLAKATSTPISKQQLGDRDVVMIAARDARMIHVTGLVQKPNQFELPDEQDVRVLDAIAMAGGRSSPVADKVFVIRQGSDGGGESDAAEPAVIEVSIAKAKRNGDENLILGPGDLVSVESTVSTTVVDVVESFFRVSLGLSSTAFTF